MFLPACMGSNDAPENRLTINIWKIARTQQKRKWNKTTNYRWIRKLHWTCSQDLPSNRLWPLVGCNEKYHPHTFQNRPQRSLGGRAWRSVCDWSWLCLEVPEMMHRLCCRDTSWKWFRLDLFANQKEVFYLKYIKWFEPAQQADDVNNVDMTLLFYCWYKKSQHI